MAWAPARAPPIPELEVSPVRIRELFVAALAAVVLTAAPAPATAQGGAGQRDAAEVKAYRLTMDDIRKLAAASEAIGKAIAADPRYKEEQSVRQEIAALEKKDELSPADEKRLEELQGKLEKIEAKNSDRKNPETLDEMAKQIESEPAMANAIKSAGMTPRQYSLVMLVTAQSMMAHGFQKASGNKELPKEIQGTVLAENVKLVADNEAEITRLMEKLKEKKP
jgi:hypothetical protein